MTTYSIEISWMINKASVTKVYEGECVVKEFNGKLPYAMVMKAIKNNNWDIKNEGGQGYSSYWQVRRFEDGREYGFYYNCKTGVVNFQISEAV